MKIAFVLDSDPSFLGGTAIYFNNLLNYLKKNNLLKKFEITCIYPGKNNQILFQEDIKYVSIKTILPYPLKFLTYAEKVSNYLQNNRQEIINSHAMGGYFLNIFKKEMEKIVHTYHGMTYSFFKNHSERPLSFEKLTAFPLMFLTRYIEKPPVEYADKIIYVSNKVKKEANAIYGNGKEEVVINSGVDVSKFYPLNKDNCRKELELDKEEVCGLYVGRGGWWTKGLDRAINLAKEIKKIKTKFKLVVIGADYKKCKRLLGKNKDLINYLPLIKREDMPKYYSACNFFLCCSRYEGGAPTLSTAEAMASGCLVICSNDSEQEIIQNGKNGLIINFEKANLEIEAKRMLKCLNNKKLINNSMRTIKNISTKEFLNKYVEELLEK